MSFGAGKLQTVCNFTINAWIQGSGNVAIDGMITQCCFRELVTIAFLLVAIASSWTLAPDPWPIRRKAIGSVHRFSSSTARRVNRPYNTHLLSLSNHNDSSLFTSTVLEFINRLEASINYDQFLGFTLHGPSKDAFNEFSEARGNLRMIKGRSIILSNKVMIQATFKYHGATDVCKNWSPQDCRQNLEAILLSTTTSEVIPVSEWGTALPTTFGNRHGIQSASLQTFNGTNWELKAHRGRAMLKSLSKSHKVNQIVTDKTSKHDRNKYTFVDVSNPVWLALGVTSPLTGTVKPGMSSKLRQCQKFVEIVEKLVNAVANSEKHLTPNITVVDMGCGRGYLTFALHSYLYRYYRELVSSRGIDVRPKLVKEISGIASDRGSEFERLQFEVGTIESFLAESPSEPSSSRSIEVVIALHACDTATDDALWSGIYRKSEVIVVAPCCHREIRPQLNQHVGGDGNNEHPYSDILRHNIYRERMAETITDSMRAILLELCGYTVQVFEFIGGEHTSKNVMITAVRNDQPTNSSNKVVDEIYGSRLKRLQSLAKLHGIQKHKLATWIGVPLSDIGPYPHVNRILRSHSNAFKMPPLQR